MNDFLEVLPVDLIKRNLVAEEFACFIADKE